MNATEKEEPHFRRIQEFDIEYVRDARISQYVSTKTGMRVVVASQPGPMVYGYLVVATEIHDDSGAPHTLEHLCFFGSQSYPNCNFLQRLITRSYGSDNAWTAVDNTTYLLTTAGWPNFAQVLPVYLDHVLYPLLPESAYVTEVHHVDGEGKDGGVCYCEMQADEKDDSCLLWQAGVKNLYPPTSGYRSETGGKLKNLRQLSIDRIRQYHKEMYRPENLCVAICGDVDIDDLLKILTKFEHETMSRVEPDRPAFKRPWVSSAKLPDIAEPLTQTIEFPEEDETTGSVDLFWRGPRNDLTDIQGEAISLALNYLTGSVASPIRNILVEREHRCGSVDVDVMWHMELCIEITLSAVTTAKLEATAARFEHVLQESINNPLDMNYMRDCIHRSRRQRVQSAETDSTDALDVILSDHLFGDREGRGLLKKQATLGQFDELLSWTEDQWRKFMSKWFLEHPHSTIYGKPSAALNKTMDETESRRVKDQQESLGREGLEKAGARVKQARAANEQPLSNDAFDHYPLFDVTSIKLPKSSTARYGLAERTTDCDEEAQHIIDNDKCVLPLYIHFESIPSQFINISILLSTEDLPEKLRPMTSLYMCNLFGTPLTRHGQRLSYEQVCIGLERETNGFGAAFGGACSDMIRITISTESSKYETVISWLKNIMYDYILDKDRLMTFLKQIIANIPLNKRDASYMMSSVQTMVEYSSNSTARATNTLVDAVVLRRIKSQLERDPESIITMLQDYIHIMHQPSNYRIAVTGDLTKIKSPVSAWASIVPSEHDNPNKELSPLADANRLTSDALKHPGNILKIMPMSTVESCYARFTAVGPKSYDHPDLPALSVVEDFMNSLDGPFMQALRAEGLVYGIYTSSDCLTGQVFCEIYQSTNGSKAFIAAKRQIEGLVDGSIVISKHDLENSIATEVKDLVEKSQKYAHAASRNVLDQVTLERGKGWGTKMMAKIQMVTTDQMREVINRYYLNLFNPTKVNGYITCSGNMKEVYS